MERINSQRLEPIHVDSEDECMITAFVCPLGSCRYTDVVSKMPFFAFIYPLQKQKHGHRTSTSTKTNFTNDRAMFKRIEALHGI
jgi:hypothetical protein